MECSIQRRPKVRMSRVTYMRLTVFLEQIILIKLLINIRMSREIRIIHSEFWRRAAMARMSLGSTSNSSASSPPSSAYLQHTRDQQQPHEPQRRQRSVYTSDQECIASCLCRTNVKDVYPSHLTDRSAGGLLQCE